MDEASPSLSNAANIPFDVLSTILQLAYHDDEDPSYPEDLLLVCKWWNMVVMQSPSLWNIIRAVLSDPGSLQSHLARTTAYLTRSRTSLLNIRITLSRHRHHCYRWSYCPECSSRFHEIVELIGHLMGPADCHLTRWRALSLDFQKSDAYQFSHDGRTFDFPQIFWSHSMPQIQQLEILAPRGWGSSRAEIKSLETLPGWLKSAMDSYTSPPKFPALTSLTIKGGDDTAFSKRSILSNLTTLHLETNSGPLMRNVLSSLIPRQIQRLHLLTPNVNHWTIGSLPSIVPIIEEAVNLQVLVIEPGLQEDIRNVLEARNQGTTIITECSSYYEGGSDTSSLSWADSAW